MKVRAPNPSLRRNRPIASGLPEHRSHPPVRRPSLEWSCRCPDRSVRLETSDEDQACPRHAGDPRTQLWSARFARSQDPNAPWWRAKASDAKPRCDRSTLLRLTSETAHEAQPAKVLTRSVLPIRMNQISALMGISHDSGFWSVALAIIFGLLRCTTKAKTVNP